MSHRTTAGVFVLAAVPALIALPTVTASSPTPHPVSAKLTELSLPLTPAAARAQGGTPAQARAAAGTALVDTGERPTARFVGLGATWAHGAGVAGLTVKVKVRAGGSWGGWETLAAQDAVTTTEAGTTPERDGTDPLLTDPADGVQVQVFSPTGQLPADLRLDLVDPGTSQADAHLVASAPAGSAVASASKPAVVTRAAWGANESYRSGTPSYSATVKAAIIHHTATSNDYSPAAAAGQIRAIYAYHTRSLGWSDVGYQFLVDKYGTLYEGRAGGMDKATIGAHTAGFNVDTFAISALGNYETVDPPAVMLDSMSALIAWKLSIHHRNPLGTATLTASGGTASLSRYANGVTVNEPTIFAHRDTGYTTCPGKKLYGVIADTVRTKVADAMGTMIYDPALSASSALTPGGSPIDFSARTDSDRPWSATLTSVDTGVAVRTWSGSTSANTLAGTWDLRDASGQLAPAGGYDLTISSGDALPATLRITLKAPAPVLPPAAPGAPGVGEVPLPPVNEVYTLDSGPKTVNGRLWRTRCEPYVGPATRCWTDIVATTTKKTSHGFDTTKDWTFNNLTYRDWDNPMWQGNILAIPGEHTSGGRQWKTECNTDTPGWRACTSYIWATVVSRQSSPKGYVYKQYNTWQFNNMVWLKALA